MRRLALVMRARDLFYTSLDRFEEEESVDDAVHPSCLAEVTKEAPFRYSKHKNPGFPKSA
jgi:hypothetical protein